MDTPRFMRMIGWFDGEDSEVATHDPIPNNTAFTDVPSLDDVAQCRCLICEEPLREGPIKTINIRWLEGFKRSYFYRVHLLCYMGNEQDASDKAWAMIEEFAMEEPVKA